MEEVLNMTIDPATAASMAITAAGKVAEHWLAANPTAAAHLKAGWHVAVEVVVTTDPATLQISFVDPADGNRYVQAMIPLSLSAIA